jgi:hypothetical protein
MTAVAIETSMRNRVGRTAMLLWYALLWTAAVQRLRDNGLWCHGFALVSTPPLYSNRARRDVRQQQHCPFPPPFLASSRLVRTTSSSSSSSLHVFERMSEECIAGLVTAQQQTAKFGLDAVEPPLVLAGCVDHPESSALSKTLARYGITWRRVETVMSSLYVAKNDKQNNEDKPFSAATKYTLQRAGKLADSMQCKIVSSHHVFLALLDYQEGRSVDDSNRGTIAATATDANDAWNVLLKLNVLPSNTTALDICTTLVTFLTLEPAASAAKTNKVLVSAGQGSDTKTPTLSEVGIDLTEQARLGLLDKVHGRDAEIRAALRTLLRRRKNNVVLIGEAGVGAYSMVLLPAVCVCVFVTCNDARALAHTHTLFLALAVVGFLLARMVEHDSLTITHTLLLLLLLQTHCRQDGHCRGHCPSHCQSRYLPVLVARTSRRFD